MTLQHLPFCCRHEATQLLKVLASYADLCTFFFRHKNRRLYVYVSVYCLSPVQTVVCLSN